MISDVQAPQWDASATFAAGLARFLSERWGRDVTVPWISQSSAGARRLNLLFDADDGHQKHELVATVIPNAAIQILSISTEADMLRQARAAGVPVPEVHFDCTDETYVGGPFFITTRIAGETVPRRVLRLVQTEGHGETIAAQLGAAFAALHRIPAAEAPTALVRPGSAPAAQALLNLQLGVDNLLQPAPVYALALRWLERHLPPAPPSLTVVHGDIRNGNVIVCAPDGSGAGSRGPGGLAAILDWELTKVGDPMEDLAWPCLRCWRFGVDAVEVGGFGSRATMVEAYTHAGGQFDPMAFHWWKVMGTMRWGLGLAGQAKQHLDGSVPSIVMAASGRRVAELEYDLLCLLRPNSLRPGLMPAQRAAD